MSEKLGLNNFILRKNESKQKTKKQLETILVSESINYHTYHSLEPCSNSSEITHPVYTERSIHPLE